MKKCTNCMQLLRLTSFTKDGKSRDGLKSCCKECRSAYSAKRRLMKGDHLRKQSAEWARKNPEKVLDNHYKTNYGITLEKFNKMVALRNGKCDLCSKVPKGKLVVDHDHRSLKIRGLLCRSCNGALGVLGDTVEDLEKAILYITGALYEKNYNFNIAL